MKINYPTINFIAKRNIAMLCSLVFIVIAVISLSIRGLNFGIDFTGGTVIELQKDEQIAVSEVREKLASNGFEDFSVAHFGSVNEIIISLRPNDTSSAALSSRVLSILGDDFTMRRIEFVGPKVGEDLTQDGSLAMLYALIGILIYVALRFEYRFAVGSVAALIHDILIILGFFSVLQIQFDLTVLAAILAVIGYSLNDTVVVFDRVRENFLNTRKTESTLIINDALNQTLARTLVTSLTTLLVLVSLFIFGGEIIKGFAIALIVGVLVGTYSSIYIASNTILMMNITKEHLLPSEKEEQEIRARP